MKDPFKGKTSNAGRKGRLEVWEAQRGKIIITLLPGNLTEYQNDKEEKVFLTKDQTVIQRTSKGLSQRWQSLRCVCASLIRRGQWTIPSKRCYDMHIHQWKKAEYTERHQTGTHQVQGTEKGANVPGGRYRKLFTLLLNEWKTRKLKKTIRLMGFTDLDLLSHYS